MKKIFDVMNTAPVAGAGSTVADIMRTAPAALAPLCCIDEAIAHIRQAGTPGGCVVGCYVVEEDRTLRGAVSLRTLLLTQGDVLLEAVMERPFVTLRPTDDQELAAQLMEEYDLLELPVVDEEDRLCGVVTADDAMEVLQEEATEDMERMAAMAPSEEAYLEEKDRKIFRSRIPWLLLLMLSAAFTGGIISYFEEALAAQVALTAFIPMLMDTGGNCGSQSSVTVIRGLALGEMSLSDWGRVLWKELRISSMCAVALAAVNFVRLMAMSTVGLSVAAVVSLTLAVTVIVSDLIGALLPILARRIGFDPAVMASPLITTLVDAVSLLTYFKLATWLLPM